MYNKYGDTMKEILNKEQIMRSLRRITHEIIEKNDSLENLILVGIKRKGLPVAKIIKNNILEFSNIDIPIYELDISNYRDDVKINNTNLNNFVIDEKNVILVDDVLYTGRTVRAALDALNDLGRFNKLQLVVLVDRGHRELPIRADYVGKNIPTSKDEKVLLDLNEFTLHIAQGDSNKDANQ